MLPRRRVPIARRPATLVGVLGTLATALLAAMPMPALAETTCDRVAAANGSDAAAGTAAAPYATVRRLAGSLSSGQTGCVRGTVRGDVWVSRPGVTLTSEPGQRGKIAGQVVIDPAASFVTLRDLDLDSTGVGRPSPIVLGDDATFVRNDITNNHTPIVCMILGAKNHDSGARAERTRIYDNRIHDCGTVDNHRHGLYVEHALDTRIVGNVFHDNADRAIQLYPDAQNTTITGNVIDGNGEGIIFSGNGPYSASGSIVRGNVLTNPRLRAVVESWYPSGTPIGQNNLVEFNCLHGAARLIDSSNGGFVARDNTFADPLYVDRAAKDFRLREGSPCAALLAAGRAEALTYPQPTPDTEVPAPTVPAPEVEPTPAPTAPAPAPSAPVKPSGKPAKSDGASKPPVKREAEAEATPVAFAAAPSVRVSVARKRGRRVALSFRLADGATDAVRALIEVRTGNGAWRALATPRLVPGRAYRRTLKLRRGSVRVQARATVVDESPSVVAEFRR